MTNSVHILRCALCKRSFSYEPKDTDLYRPDEPNMICTPCFERMDKENRLSDERYDAMMAELDEICDLEYRL